MWCSGCIPYFNSCNVLCSAFFLRVEDGCRSETRIYFESYLNLTSFEYLHFLYMISMWASDALKCPGVAVNVIIRPGTELHSCQKQAA